MRDKLLIVGMVIAVGAVGPPVLGTPIPGSSNEIVNGDFENGTVGNPPPAPWEVTGTEVVTSTVGNPGNGAMCNNYLAPGVWGNQLRQVVDDSLNPLWNPNFHMKIIDLQVDIMGDALDPGEGVRFRLDWWGEDFNDVDDPAQLPAPTGYGSWMEYTDPAGDWTTVNPVNRALFYFQPRWVSVEIEFMQPDPTVVLIDNVVLTAKCVPEPATISLLAFGGLLATRRQR